MDTARRQLSSSQGERTQEKPNLWHLWCCTLQHQICTSSILQNCEKINFCCLHYPFCGILWQPKQAKTGPPNKDFLGVFGPQSPLLLNSVSISAFTSKDWNAPIEASLLRDVRQVIASSGGTPREQVLKAAQLEESHSWHQFQAKTRRYIPLDATATSSAFWVDSLQWQGADTDKIPLLLPSPREIWSWSVHSGDTFLNPPQKERMPPSFQLGLLEEEFHPVRPTGFLSEGLALPTNDLILRRTAAPPSARQRNQFSLSFSLSPQSSPEPSPTRAQNSLLPHPLPSIRGYGLLW